MIRLPTDTRGPRAEQTDELLAIPRIPNILFADGLYDGLTANMFILDDATDALSSAVQSAAGGDDGPLRELDRSKRIDTALGRLRSYLGGNIGLAYAFHNDRPLNYDGWTTVARHRPSGRLILWQQSQ